MSYEFESFSVGPIRDLLTVGKDEYSWIDIQVSFTDPETGAHPQIQVTVPVPYERTWTIDRVRQAAFDKAKEVLAETMTLYERHGLAELQQLHDEREAAQASR